MIVGEAEVLVVPNTAGFDEALRAESAEGLQGLESDAGVAGENAGANLRKGVSDGAAGVGDDLQALGGTAGASMRQGISDGVSGVEGDLGEAGALGGMSFRDRARSAVSGFREDMHKEGTTSGLNFTSGLSSGLSGLGRKLEQTGLPFVSQFGSALSRSGTHMDETGKKAGGLANQLGVLGGGVVLAGGAVAAGIGALGVKFASDMQTATVSIANAERIGEKAAGNLTKQFTDMGGTAMFSGQQIATAFAGAAGQLEATQGRALTTKESVMVMKAAMNLAAASGTDLNTATASLALTMQAFHTPAKDAAAVTDVLYNTSRQTGAGIDTLAASMAKVRGTLGSAAPSVKVIGGLMVDMADHSIVGRKALTAMGTTMNALLKPAADVITAQQKLAMANGQIPGSLRGIADEVLKGNLTTKQQDALTKGLTESQKTLISNLKSAEKSLETAKEKQAALGVTTMNAQGQMLPLATILDELHKRVGDVGLGMAAARLRAMGLGSAATVLAPLVLSGGAALRKTTADVSAHNSAAEDAARVSKTLHGQWMILKADIEDLATKFGQALMPILIKVGKVLVETTKFVVEHKAVLIALASVVGGILATSLAIAGVQKLKAFGKGFIDAKNDVETFAKAIGRVVSTLFGSNRAQQESADAQMEADKEKQASTEQTSKVQQDAADNAASTNEAMQTGAQETADAVTASLTEIETSLGELGGAFETLGTTSEATWTELAAQAETGASSIEMALSTIGGTADSAMGSLEGATAGMQGALERTAAVAETSMERVDAALGGVAGSAATAAGEVDGSLTLEQGAMTETATVAETTAAEVDTALGSERMAGIGAGGLPLGVGGGAARGEAVAAAEGEGMALGTEGELAGGAAGAAGLAGGVGMSSVLPAAIAGVGAFMGTSELLKHTPLGSGLLDAITALPGEGAIASFFGVGASPSAQIGSGTEKLIKEHGGMAGFEKWAQARIAQEDKTSSKSHEDALRQLGAVDRIANVLTGMDVLPKDILQVQREGFGRDIGTIAGQQIGMLLQRYLQETGGKINPADIAPLLGELHVHDSKATAQDIVREMSFAVRTGHVSTKRKVGGEHVPAGVRRG